jgi:hypothetical protein
VPISHLPLPSIQLLVTDTAWAVVASAPTAKIATKDLALMTRLLMIAAVSNADASKSVCGPAQRLGRICRQRSGNLFPVASAKDADSTTSRV